MENKDILPKKILNIDSLGYQAEVWYRAYGVTIERMELFYDFINSVYELVDTTYLGSDTIVTEEEQKTHFTWCWDRVIDNLSKEKINLNKRGIHYEYFWDFFLESFYFLQMDGKEIKISNYIYRLFDYKHQKTRSELGVFTEIYKLLDNNLT